MKRLASILASSVLLGSLPAAQVFVRDAVNVPAPGGARYVENVDFADVEQDGDWDAALARGGDFGNLQNELWINQGGLQAGVLGAFVDDTAARLPAVSDDSRDVEFVDYDGDDDSDLFVSNTSSVVSQGNRFWTNVGSASGSYVDETSTRWIGVGEPGSSVAPSLVLANGSFVDWSGDSDFGDVDNDGDMDLVQSSYGSAFSGTTPTRVFLNDGAGLFQEFNPSGVQLGSATIPDGTAGLWCQGDQQANTTDATGSFCDVATNGIDVDLGDIDGDFDLDVLLGDRDLAPRMFANLREEAGFLRFRDVTSAAFPAGYAVGAGHFEQEMGDLDNDGDLDIYGEGWAAVLFNYDDVTLRNAGDGTFGNLAIVPDTGTDASECDLFDYDNDGLLDVFIANFSGADGLYRNAGLSGGAIDLVAIDGATSGLDAHGLTAHTALDGDACDWDEDGDYDVLTGLNYTQPAVAWLNQTGVPDTTAPSLPAVEAVADRDLGTSCADPIPVRAHVYDNAPYYVTYFNATVVDLAVDGIALDALPARSSGGQVFRAELPPNLVGQVEYAFRSSDAYGNEGTSATEGYLSTNPGPSHAVPYGTGGDGSLGPVGFDAKSALTPCLPLYLTISNTPPGTLYLLVVGTASSPPTPLPSGGIWNVAGLILPATRLGLTDAAGTASERFLANATIGTGFSIYAQAFTFDGVGGDPWASSLGLELPSLP